MASFSSDSMHKANNLISSSSSSSSVISHETICCNTATHTARAHTTRLKLLPFIMAIIAFGHMPIKTMAAAIRTHTHFDCSMCENQSPEFESAEMDAISVDRIEWSNPCGGTYVPNKHEHTVVVAEQRPLRLRELRRSVGEYKYLNHTLFEIDVTGMREWDGYMPTYSFLPTIHRTSKIALKCWYCKAQVYAASFAHLKRVQNEWDDHKSNQKSAIALELNELLLSARRLLCEIETAINGSTTVRQRLPIMSSRTMAARLKFHTKANRLMKCDDRDLRFAKNNYLEFLKTMWQILQHHRRQLRNQRRKYQEVLNRNMYSESSSSESASESLEFQVDTKQNRSNSLHRSAEPASN